MAVFFIADVGNGLFSYRFCRILPLSATIVTSASRRSEWRRIRSDLSPARGRLWQKACSRVRCGFLKGGGSLKDMTTLLAELPDGVSDIGKADKLAAKMADELKAAVGTNPLLKATGPILNQNCCFRARTLRRHASQSLIFPGSPRTTLRRISSTVCK